ncbi:MAG: class IV adenylate cyclase [Acidobacteriota bacterium]
MTIAEEIETKFAVAEFDVVRRMLSAVGGTFLSRRFEENVVLDDGDATLRSRDVLLRIRRDAACKLTLKLPAEAPERSGLKIRREIETEVADGAALEAVFAALGYAPFLRYEKVRETWRVGDALVCLDELPFGRYLEIEGPAAAIGELAGRLGLAMEQALPQTYHELHQAYRRAHGLPPDMSFVFTAQARRAILDSLAASH